MKMLSAILVSIVLVIRATSGVIVTVQPPVVELGITPSVTISCLGGELEGNIASISIFRTSAAVSNNVVAPRELVAEIRGTAPTVPVLTPGIQNATVRGQISIFEEVLGTFLEVVITNPKVQDLGVYTCEAKVLGSAGGQILFSEARVTTANAVTDRLLISVLILEQELDTYNRSLVKIQSQIDNITAAQGTVATNVAAVATTAAEVATTVGEVTTTLETTTEAIPEVTYSIVNESSTVTTTDNTRDTELLRLVEAIGFLEVKFDKFNGTLQRLDRILTALELKTLTDRGNETVAEQVITDILVEYFVLGNASYYLFQTSGPTDVSRAQNVCLSKNFYLAEITNEEDFKNISTAIDVHVSDGGSVLVGGQKTLGQDFWLYQDSQRQVTFFPVEFTEQVGAVSDECLSLQKSELGLSLVPVPCAGEQENNYVLCQQDSIFS